jgi:aspartate ammonia-lyase
MESSMTIAEYRSEHDLLGDREVLADVYYGIHTVRATENFPISGIPIAAHPDLVNALAAVKQAAAAANRDLGLLAAEKAGAIVAACEEIRSGSLHEQFVVDVIQGGAGTSANMNANEVIANRALEHLGRQRGEYTALHPLDDVNKGQSTNDVYPTAVKVALHWAAERLLEAMAVLREAFSERGDAFSDVVKVGRTQLQDAVPMTLGQEFTTYAIMIGEDEQRLAEALRLLHEVNLGGTAIGTQLNAPAGYAESVRGHLAQITGIPLVTSPNLVEATQDAGSFVQLSGVLKRIAVKLSKICNDLRLLASGPGAGFNEINLPPVQAGSSIMPGKVNPVIPEVVNQIAFEVVGNDVTVSMAAEGGQLQLNAFEPIIAHSLFDSVTHLEMGCRTLATRCVKGITANVSQLRAQVEHCIGAATALNPFIGYAQTTAIAQEAAATGRTVYDLALSKGLLSKEQLDVILSPEALAGMQEPDCPPESEI